MVIDLVLAGVPDRIASEIRTFLSGRDVQVWSAAELSDVPDMPTDGYVFVAMMLNSEKDIPQARALLAGTDLRESLVAILPAPTFAACAAAFRGGAVDVISLPMSPQEGERCTQRLRSIASRSLHPDAIVPLDEIERRVITAAITACGGQVSKTSRKLGIGRSTLYRKMEQYGLMDVKE